MSPYKKVRIYRKSTRDYMVMERQNSRARQIIKRLTRIESMLQKLTVDLATKDDLREFKDELLLSFERLRQQLGDPVDKLVSYEWIRENRGPKWRDLTDQQIYHRLYREGIKQHSKGYYWRSDLFKKKL